MKVLKKLEEEVFDLVEVENGKEVGGSRTEQELYDDGYKKAIETDGEGTWHWEEYPECWLQVWDVPEPQPEPENE